MKKLYGTVVPIVTPFTEEDTIDVESLKNLVDHVIDGGLQGVYPCGTTGEMMYLTVGERKQVTEVAVAQAAKRVPVFAQVGAWNLSDTIELAQHAEKTGADGIGVVTPVFYKLSDQGLIDFYTAVAKSVSKDFPVYLYAIPQNAGNDINAAVCEVLVKQCPNIVGIKYSYPDFTRLQQLMMVNDQKFSRIISFSQFAQQAETAWFPVMRESCANIMRLSGRPFKRRILSWLQNIRGVPTF